MPHAGRKTADDQLALALACGAAVEAAARSAGVSRRTAHRRLKDPAFLAKLQALAADMVRQQTAALTASGMEFVTTVVELAKAPNPGKLRLEAARTGLEYGMKMRVSNDLEQRLAALERRVDGAPDGEAAGANKQKGTEP
jgi:hypothetical protein